jgi:hypothetical protein
MIGFEAPSDLDHAKGRLREHLAASSHLAVSHYGWQ